MLVTLFNHLFIQFKTMHVKHIGFFILLCVLQVSQTLVAQFTPYFQNYSLSDYNAGNQNWGISKSTEGKLYVANDKGLLEFDRFKWSLVQMPNKTTIRSVLAVIDKIYVGSYEEFGYWKKDAKGELKYTSLSKLIEKNAPINEEFWQIVSYRNSIIFRSFSNIYIFNDGVIKKIKTPSTIISCDVVKNVLYVSTLRNGILILKNDELVVSILDNTLINTKVVSVSNYNDGLLITTALNGCYLYKGKKLISLNFEIDSLLKKYQLNSHSILGNGNMVFGTIQNGVYYTDAYGKIIFHVNKENGLANNTILCQYLDADNELWLGLDNGLASIDLKEHHTFYNDISGKLGAVYDVISYKGTIYLGSNTGLYFLDNLNNLQFVEGSQGQVWDLKEINGNLFCGHNNGTYLVEKDKIKLISNFTGGWVIKKVPEQSNIFMQGTYAGIVRFKYGNGNWEVKHMRKSTDPIQFLVFEDQYHAWAAHAYKGLYRISFDKNYDSIASIKSYVKKGLLSEYNVRVYKIKNEICFKTNNGWQRYEPLRDSIVPYKLLNDNWGKDSYIISEDPLNILAIKNKDAITFKNLANPDNDLFLMPKYFKKRLIVDFENVSKINDSIYALSLNDGFMMIDGNFKATIKASLAKPTIERIEINKQLIDLTSNKEIEVPFNKSITIAISSALSRDHFFEYAISNTEPIQWSKMENEKLELSSLNNGEYTVLFRAANDLGEKSLPQNIGIKVLPPWYKGKTGFLLFGFLLLLLIGAVYFLHKRKVKKEQRVLQFKFVKEQRELLREKAIQNEKRIIQLKNESLKNEVKLKSKQLANTAMALVKKNESIQEIKKELLEYKNSLDNTYSFRKLLKKLDDSVGHEDEWEVFEYNFNQVHEEFFNKLKTQFPDLTHKDLKICAYIKMNLSNKEIAPLMNISVRGVETHRYRLKGKLKLENDISVTDFLRNFI